MGYNPLMGKSKKTRWTLEKREAWLITSVVTLTFIILLVFLVFMSFLVISSENLRLENAVERAFSDVLVALQRGEASVPVTMQDRNVLGFGYYTHTGNPIYTWGEAYRILPFSAFDDSSSIHDTMISFDPDTGIIECMRYAESMTFDLENLFRRNGSVLELPDIIYLSFDASEFMEQVSFARAVAGCCIVVVVVIYALIMKILGDNRRIRESVRKKENLISLGEAARTSHNLSRECWVPNDYARFVPTASMIECYLTADGQIWDPKSCNSYEEIFQNRDPRMTQSILAPGTAWTATSSEDPENTDPSIYTYPKLNNTRNGCMTYTGYYMRKYIEPSTVQYVSHDDNDIIILRYAEVLLNYAEAKMELGTLTQSDLDMTVNQLRDRVGMVHLDLGNLPAGSDIETEIRRERRVELFFEGHRYFDIIRWKQGSLLGEDLLGVNRRWLDQDRIAANLDELTWKTKDGEQYLLLETGRQFVDPRHYLLPVPFTQYQLNPNLLPNNPGW